MVGKLLVGFVWLNLQFSVSWLVDFQVGSCGSIFSFLCYGRQTFSGVRVAQSLVFCVMVGRFLVGFVWLNLLFSVSWLVDFLVGSCGSIIVMVGRLLVGFVRLNLQISVSCQLDFQWGSCVLIFSFLGQGWQTFSGVRAAQSLVFCVMVDRLLVGFVWLNLQSSVSWQVVFYRGSCVSIFCFLCHGWQTFSGVREAQSFVTCVMVGRLLGGFVWLNLQFSASWLVDLQWYSSGSNFSFLFHGRQTFSGVREGQSLVFCVKVGDFQWGSCGSIFSFLSHGWQTFSGVRMAQSLVFCVMVRTLLVGFVRLNFQFSASWLGDFQGGSCGSIFTFLSHGWQIFSGLVWLNIQISVSCQVYFQWGSCVLIFSFLCHGWQTFSGVRLGQTLVFCFMVGRL